MPAQQESWIATAYLSGATGPLSAGTVLCLDAAGDRFIPATSANRTAAGRPAACIAISGGDDDNIAVEAQCVGVVPPSITLLGTGLASYINVSAGGLLARQGAIDTSTVGRCDADGTAYVCFPLAGLIGASSGTAPHLNAFASGAQTVVGDAPVIIDTADIAIGIAIDTATGIITIATTGTYLVAYGVAIIQGGSGATFAIRINGTGGPDRTFTSTNNSGLSVGDVVRVSNTSILALTAGDTVEIVNFGVDASLSGFGNPTAWITMVKVA